MKSSGVLLVLGVLILPPPLLALELENVDIGVVGGVGFPGGWMDYSINAAGFARLNIPLFLISPEVMIHESFSTKGDERGGGRLSMNVLSGYLLGRYDIVYPLLHRVSPFVAAGVGVHLINSFFTDASALGGQSKTVLDSKAHLTFGIEVPLISPWFATAWGRVTYPSDILLDSGYVGVGVELFK